MARDEWVKKVAAGKLVEACQDVKLRIADYVHFSNPPDKHLLKEMYKLLQTALAEYEKVIKGVNMTAVDQQQVLREAYDRCLALKELLSYQTLGDTLTTKAEQLADAIHHYIVPEETR